MGIRAIALGTLVVVGLAVLTAVAVGLPASPIYPAPLDNASAIVDTHSERLQSAGSFVYRDTTRIRVNGTLEVNQTTNASLNTETGAALVVRHSDRGGRGSVYDDGAGNRYERRTAVDGTVTYGQPLGTATQERRFRRAGLEPLLEDISYTYEGRTRVDGTTVHEYAATTPEQVAGIVDQSVTDPRVDTTVDVRVYISRDGIVRRMTILLVQRDGDRTRSLHSTLSYSDVGETSVPEPDWVATARNRTGPTR